MVLFSVILIIVFLAFTVWASLNISSGVFLKAVCRNGKFDKGLILTFDDGPHPQNTPLILDILDRNNVKALFFVAGSKVEKYPGVLKKMSEKGHLIGNHSYSHSNLFPFYLKNTIVSELQKTAGIVAKITGLKIVYFRPPMGITNPRIAYAVRKMNYLTVGWSVRSLDTFLKEREKILSSVVKKVKGGDIVLFHDTVKGTVEMLEEFIVSLRSAGFEFCDPEEFLRGD